VISKPNGEPYSLLEFADRLPVGTPLVAYTNDEVAQVNKHKLLS